MKLSHSRTLIVLFALVSYTSSAAWLGQTQQTSDSAWGLGSDGDYDEAEDFTQQRAQKTTTPRSFPAHSQQQQESTVQTLRQQVVTTHRVQTTSQIQQTTTSQQQQRQQQPVEGVILTSQQRQQLALSQQQQKPQQLDKLIGQQQQQQFDKLTDRQEQQLSKPISQQFQVDDGFLQQSGQLQQKPDHGNLIQGSSTTAINQLKEQFLSFQSEVKVVHQSLNKTILNLTKEVAQCHNDLKTEREEIQRLSKLLAKLEANEELKRVATLLSKLETKVDTLEDKVLEEKCPRCIEGIKLELTSLSESYKETVPQLSLEVSSLKGEVTSTSRNIDEIKKHALGGFSSHAEIAQLLTQTSKALASTASSFTTTAEVVLSAQKSQESLVTTRNLCATKEAEPLKSVDGNYLQLKNETERTIQRLARLVVGKDALKINSGSCPKQLGFNTNAPCKVIYNGCYCVVTSHQAIWRDAHKYCSYHGMELASFETSEENEAVHNFAASQGGSNLYWLGGTDQTHEGTWVWSSSETPVGPFTNWYAKQPSNSGAEGEHCMEFGETLGNRWNDARCNVPKYFICEAVSTTYSVPSAPSTLGSIKSLLGLKN